MKEQSIDEFVTTTLSELENTNLDPIIDYSHADEAAQKIIDKTFNNENAGKKLSEIISENQLHEEDLIYTKKGIFDNGIQDGELSTSKVGTNAIDFCIALIHFVKQHLGDLDKQEVFIPIALKWHLGVAVFNLDGDNLGSSIIVSEPTDSHWNNLETEIIEEEWQSWGSNEYDNRDDFINELDWGEIEVAVRDSWQFEEIKRIAALLKIGGTLSNVNIETEEILSGEDEDRTAKINELLKETLEEIKSKVDDLKN